MRFRSQKGYLGIVVAILLLTVAFSSLVISYVFSNKARGIANSLMSMQAYYIAQSGLERAVYDITVNDMTCSSINGTANYTNFSFPGAQGVFTVTGASTVAGSTLTAAITAAATTLTLTNATNFAALGSVLIDSELINYSAKSGNNLTGLSRGVGGTTASAHVINSTVGQDQCLLTSIGGVPSLTSPITRRTMIEILEGTAFSPGNGSGGAGTGAGSGGGTGVSIYQTAMMIGGSVSIGPGGVIRNGSVTSSSAGFQGSTIIAGGGVVLNGSSPTYGQTQVSNGAGAFVVSSIPGNFQADIIQNSSLANFTTLWNKFFTQSKATVQAAANQSYTATTVNGQTNQLIWMSNLNTSSTLTIGSPTAPVILIVSGNMNINNPFTFYGFLYGIGSVAFNSTVNITGGFVSESALNMNGSVTITLDPAILNQASNLSGATTHSYSFVPTYLQESFA